MGAHTCILNDTAGCLSGLDGGHDLAELDSSSSLAGYRRGGFGEWTLQKNGWGFQEKVV